MHGVTKQTDPVWADVESAGLYPIAGSSEQDSGIAEVVYSAHSRQYRQSRQAASLPAPVDVGADPRHRIPSNCPPTTTVTGQLPDDPINTPTSRASDDVCSMLHHRLSNRREPVNYIEYETTSVTRPVGV